MTIFGNKQEAEVTQEILDIIGTGNFYPYMFDDDLDDPDLFWWCFGLVDTNEILVIGQRGDKIVSMKEVSPLVFPHMADRRFGIDVSDFNLSGDLSDKLYKEHFAHNGGKAS